MVNDSISSAAAQMFKENERRANRLISKGLFCLSITYAIFFVLTKIHVLDLPESIFCPFYFVQTITCVVTAYFSKKYASANATKYFAVLYLLLSITAIIATSTYGLDILFSIPIIFSCRYYSKLITLNISIATMVAFVVAKVLSVYVGITDFNLIDVPEGTVITVKDSIQDAIEVYADQYSNQLYYTVVSFVIPNLIFFVIVAFCSYTLTKRSYDMVLSQAEITSKKAAVESELKMGNSIQGNMLPNNFPSTANIDLFATMNPAKEVGGDFYDFFYIDNTRLGLVMADVSGKGVPAALFMVIAKTLIQDHAQLGLNPIDVFNQVNQKLCENDKNDMFVTAWFGILDLKTGKLDYVNAGHNPPLISKQGGDFEYLRAAKKRLPLAAMDTVRYSQESITLNAGDQLFLYTDGVTEAMNEQDELYGENRLLHFANVHKTENLQSILKDLRSDINAFAGTCPQADDITMMTLRFKQTL